VRADAATVSVRPAPGGDAAGAGAANRSTPAASWVGVELVGGVRRYAASSSNGV
jgi:hypothetical protein